LVFLVVVCKSRFGMHFKLLKSDNICSFYTKLNIEKYAVVLAGKPIITDIWKIGYLSFHYSDRKKICTSTLFFLLCFPFNIFPINNKMKLDIQCVFWKVEIKNYQNLVQFSFSPAFRQQISSMLHLFRQVFLTYAI
jgi:hypothetical protein